MMLQPRLFLLCAIAQMGVADQRRYDTVDLYSEVNANDLLRLAFQARDQIAAFLSTHTGVA